MIPNITNRPVPNAKLFLNGESPNGRSKAKKIRVCTWVLCHGVVSGEIVKRVAGQKNNGYAKQLVRSGLLVETKTESRQPLYFYTLSQTGLDLARAYSRENIEYAKYMSPSKISQSKFDHDFHVQKLTLEAIRNHRMDYVAKSRLEIKYDEGVKVPDGLWVDQSKIKIALEVEFSQKYGRVLDNTILAIIRSLEDGVYDCYFYFIRSEVIMDNYRQAMTGGRKLFRYIKNDKNRWVKEMESTRVIPEWLLDRVFFWMEDQPLNILPTMEQMLGL